MHLLTRKNLVISAALIAAYLIIQVSNSLGVLSDYFLFIIMIGLINAILAVSLNVITGFTGQFSIGHAAFMAIGAYVSAIITKLIFKIGPETSFIMMQSGFLVSLLVGSLAAAIAAYLIGIPTLRLKGDYLCIATLGFNQIVVVVLNNLSSLGGPRGFTGIPLLSNFTWIFFITVISIVVMKNFIYSIYGGQCIAIREDEIAAESLRINSTKNKIIAFMLSAFFAGMAGGLQVHLVQLAHPTQFTFLKSIDILLMAVVGGLGSIPGSVISAIILTILPEVLRFSQDLRLVIYPLILILFILKNPVPYLRAFFAKLGTRVSAWLKGRSRRVTDAGIGN